MFSGRLLEISRQPFYGLDAGIFCFAAGDSGNGAEWDAGRFRDLWPFALAFLEPPDDELMNRDVHITDCTPIYGSLQAKFGSAAKLGFPLMPRHVRPAYLAALQSALADNVRVLMDGKWPQLRSKDDRISELAKLAGIGRNTVYRIIDPEGAAKDGAYVYPRLDNIAALARALSVSAADLLTPDFAVRSPPAEQGRRRRRAA